MLFLQPCCITAELFVLNKVSLNPKLGVPVGVELVPKTIGRQSSKKLEKAVVIIWSHFRDEKTEAQKMK